jgi:2-C-methyl-D-erythritol 4-phosphate cytidylyltransferase
MFVSAIVPAAGSGLRLNPVRNTTKPLGGTKISNGVNRGLPKPLVKINKKPIFIHTLNTLSRHPDIKEIILVVSGDSLGSARQELKKYRIRKLRDIVIGGPRRSDSVRNGLKLVSSKGSLVLIHDGVRPFIGLGLISRVIKEAEKSGAAIPGVPIKSTVKRINAKSRVIKTLRRQRLYEIQTPQVFQRDLIIDAYREFPNAAAVDDSSLVERLGKRVVVIFGSYFNIKITTPEDLVFAKAILRYQKFLPVGRRKNGSEF